MTTLEQVQKIIVEYFGIEPEKVVDTAKLCDDIGCDSLDVIALTMECEVECGVEIPDEDLDGIVTVADLVKAVEKRSVVA